MKCPHCSVTIHENLGSAPIVTHTAAVRADGSQFPQISWISVHQRCPACYEAIIYLEAHFGPNNRKRHMAYPMGAIRPIPPEVTDPYRTDFAEACAVLSNSPKASAALSRRCLQAVLKDKVPTKSKDLFDQIEEVISLNSVPSHIADDLHAVRNIGNIAAHSMKSQHSGEILEVEPGEAEWNLDVLESLFDFYFVQPAVSAKRKADLNKKLKEAGKPEIK